jgi:signal transduction histidine kinase
MTRRESGRTLRARLALLYAGLFLCSGIALLAIADLPLLSFGHTSQVTRHGLRTGIGGHSRSITNLPEVLQYSGIALAVLAVLSAVLGWLVADRALRPLRTITAAARAISASNLDERLSLGDSYEEFRDLGATLDELFARLEAAFESQRHFVANASHELRTPLAAERAVIQVALADPAASVDSLRSACHQLLKLGEEQERLVDALLTLAVSQRGLRKREPFDLAEVTGGIVQARSAVAADRGLRVDTSLAPASMAGDPNLVESLVANLVDNAIRHNVTGGSILIATKTTAGAACFSISNTGPVVPPGDVDRLFEPFRQLDDERTSSDTGHGLGLAIVRSIAAAHGASVAACARAEGGLDINVSFCLAEPGQAGSRHGRDRVHAATSDRAVTGSVRNGLPALWVVMGVARVSAATQRGQCGLRSAR